MTQQVRKIPTVHGEVAVFKGRAIKPGPDGFSPHQYGKTEKGNLELLIHLNIPEVGFIRTTPLYFSGPAAPYSWERLHALGKEGDDITNLEGIDKNEVDIEARGDTFEGKFNVKWQILTGGGQFKTANPIAPKEFAALLKASTGTGAGPNPTGGAPEPPPF